MIRDIAEEWKNYLLVLKAIESSNQPSRASLAKQLGLSRTTTSIIASDLVDYGLIEELAVSVNGRGRPGIPLKLDTHTWFALGASFQNAEWTFVLTDLAGTIVQKYRKQPQDTSVPAFCSTLISGITRMSSLCQGKLLPLVGVGTPGLVNTEKGIILRADDMGWRNISLGDQILQETGFQSIIMNRYLCGGLAEARFGAGKNYSSLLYVGISTGIKAAIIQKGEIVKGASFSAGEIGHVQIDPNGPLCGCGRKGCLQAMTSIPALMLAAEKKFGKNTDAVYICKQADDGNNDAAECIKKIALPLGVAVGNMINILDPEKIIIGGTLGRASRLLTTVATTEARKRAVHPLKDGAHIVQSNLGDLAETLGAACLALQYKGELVIGKK